MTEPLPKWLMKKYALLWNKFGNNPFTQKEVSATLKENDFKLISVILSELSRAGWIKAKRKEDDARKKEYHLIGPLQAVNEMGVED